MQDVEVVNSVGFDQERFALADQVVASLMQGYTTGSTTIREAIDELNQEVINAAAQERSDLAAVQWLYRTFWTLTRRNAVSITNQIQNSIGFVLKQSEAQLREIVGDITVSRRKEERLRECLGELSERMKTPLWLS